MPYDVLAKTIREACGGTAQTPEANDLRVRYRGDELILRGAFGGFQVFEHPVTGRTYLSPPHPLIPSERGGLELLDAGEADGDLDVEDADDDVPDFSGETAAAQATEVPTTDPTPAKPQKPAKAPKPNTPRARSRSTAAVEA